ncbi:MAG: hypothetical protein E2O40_00095 [Planctomycetota bacterium]|nr:MAG: hypothetical protein E2O40_00095 [Planctomycetota bacterium]
MTTDEHSEVAVVVRVPTEFEAYTIAAILHEGGIEATVAPGAPSWTGQIALSPSSQGSAVVVRSADLRRARTVLDESDRDSVDLNWDEVDVGEREDNLPLTPVGRMPIPAKIAAALAAAILIVTALLGVVLLFF